MSSLRDRSGRTIWFQVRAWGCCLELGSPQTTPPREHRPIFCLLRLPLHSVAGGLPLHLGGEVTRTSCVVGSRLTDGEQSGADGGNEGIWVGRQPCSSLLGPVSEALQVQELMAELPRHRAGRAGPAPLPSQGNVAVYLPLRWLQDGEGAGILLLLPAE